MNNLYNKIYEAVSTGIQKALIISDGQTDDVSVIFHNKEISSDFIPYDQRLVNLGLPSGLLWCEYNLGAYPGNVFDEWYGDFYAWGETETKSDYSWKTYKYYNELSNILTKYTKEDIENGKTVLEKIDDVVTIKLGDQYHMPTKQDFQELSDNTTQRWVENYKGVHRLNGILLTSKNNSNTLFFPAAGYHNENTYDYDGSFNGVWSSSIKEDNPPTASYFFIYSESVSPDTFGKRYYGFSIRGVKNSKPFK